MVAQLIVRKRNHLVALCQPDFEHRKDPVTALATTLTRRYCIPKKCRIRATRGEGGGVPFSGAISPVEP